MTAKENTEVLTILGMRATSLKHHCEQLANTFFRVQMLQSNITDLIEQISTEQQTEEFLFLQSQFNEAVAKLQDNLQQIDRILSPATEVLIEKYEHVAMPFNELLHKITGARGNDK